ncbi:MAG: GNAT family N-acetyltransferase [Candidatus Omnitrophica bacterium]|nr:GNAT family N-acetyltransferase [Candidatus Omnitrophota bacterium]
MMQLAATQEDMIYQAYVRKNAPIAGTGYFISKEALLKHDTYVVLYHAGEPVLFFSKSTMRDKEKTMLSNFLILADVSIIKTRSLLEEYIKSQSGHSFICVVEEYLKDEYAMINDGQYEVDHIAIRMWNKDVSRFACPDPENITIEPFRVGHDEQRFVDIFNETFVGLCTPTNKEEVIRWTKAPGFYPDLYLFAVKNKKTIGFIAVEIDIDSGISYLQEIGVGREERNTSAAGFLICTAYRSVRDKGVKCMGVGVLKRNVGAYKFFSKWGFEELYRRIFLRRIV